MEARTDVGVMVVVVDSKELKDFISSAINSVASGLKEQDYVVGGAIEFELAVLNAKKKGAGIYI